MRESEWTRRFPVDAVAGWVRRQLPQGTMRAHQVVVRAPCFDSLVCIVETDERKLVQIRFAQSAVEALDVRIFYRLTRTAER